MNNQFRQYIYDVTNLLASPSPHDTNLTVAFESAWIPTHSDGASSTDSEGAPVRTDTQSVNLKGTRCASFDGPALYCSGVRAFDETRGVLVLGSAFGELAVYDMSQSPAAWLEECFQALSPSSRSVEHENRGADTNQDLTVSKSVPDFCDTRDHEH